MRVVHAHISTPSVLLVDDNPDVLLLWRLVLCEGGEFRIHEARDVPSAVAHVERSCPDVVLTDYAMPGGSGLEVIDAARRQRDDVVIVMASNSYDVGDEALRRGASAFLNKYQSTTDRLPTMVWQLLAEAGSVAPPVLVGGPH